VLSHLLFWWLRTKLSISQRYPLAARWRPSRSCCSLQQLAFCYLSVSVQQRRRVYQNSIGECFAYRFVKYDIIWYMIICYNVYNMIYMIWYDTIRYDIYDMIWYMIICYNIYMIHDIWYDLIRDDMIYMIYDRYVMMWYIIRYVMMWYIIWYGIICYEMIYDIRYDIWYDTIWLYGMI